MDPNAAAPARPLDDIMIAMDVVDTLRHDKRILERELNDDARRAELIDRLRELYRSQGIEVPDSILEEGVRALEEKRFVYSPPDGSLEVRLARLYVTRDRWKPWVLGMAFLAFAALSTWYLLYERPRAAEQAAITQELEQDLPKKLTTLSAQIAKESTSEAVVKEAREIAESAASAAAAGQLAYAREGAQRLTALLDEIRREFDIRIVNRPGEITGLWRVPKVNPNQRNYYLLVEATDASGQPVGRQILNEETGERDVVTRWAVRVPKSVFDEIQADKLDDGIIQKAVIGSKKRGEREISWIMEVSGGALTKW
jgi:hypothetical protein